MGEDSIQQLNSNQKDKIFNSYLMPLKTKISEILLYDTQAAFEFLQDYNEIIENEEQRINEILKAITVLEIKIGEYENSKGKEKVFEEKNKAILQLIDELENHSVQMSLEEFESEFSSLKNDYNENIQEYNLKDRDSIQGKFYELQATLMQRQLTGGRTMDELQQSLTEQDKEGLKIFLNIRANSLKQREATKDIANKISNIIMTDKDAVVNSELWSWLISAGKVQEKDEQLQSKPITTSTAMVVASKSKNNTFINRMSKIFSKEPTFPLEVSDLKKINIEWLSKNISKSMLIELEEQRLNEEQRQVENKYVPDSKLIVYKFFTEILKKKKDRTDNTTWIEKYELLEKNGGKLEVEIGECWNYVLAYENYPYLNVVTIKSGDIIKKRKMQNFGRS